MPSSVIHGMLFSPERKTLDVVFRDGETYRYQAVTAAEWRAFKRAPSKGTYLNATFKAKHPRYEKVEAGHGSFAGSLAASVALPGATRDVPDENVWGFYENSL